MWPLPWGEARRWWGALDTTPAMEAEVATGDWHHYTISTEASIEDRAVLVDSW